MLRETPQPASDPVVVLGARVRELRRDRGLTLKALGVAAGLSHPFLSQLERGLARPSMSSMERIARALGVPMSALWTTPHKDAQVVLASDGVVRPYDNPEAPGAVRDVMVDGTTLRVREWTGGPRTWPEERDTTTGEVLVYVVRGVLEVDVDGTVHALREGDSLFFDGSVRHRLRRRGGKLTRALYVASG